MQRRARRHGRSIEEEVREILRNTVRDESTLRKPLGSRLRERFASIGLEDELPELRSRIAPDHRQSAEFANGTCGIPDSLSTPIWDTMLGTRQESHMGDPVLLAGERVP